MAQGRSAHSDSAFIQEIAAGFERSAESSFDYGGSAPFYQDSTRRQSQFSYLRGLNSTWMQVSANFVRHQ